MDYFIESSAKTGLNTEKIFIQAAKLLYKEYDRLRKIQNPPKKEKNKKLEIADDDIHKKKNGCC